MCIFQLAYQKKKITKNTICEGSDPVYAVCQSRLCSSDKRETGETKQPAQQRMATPRICEKTVCTKLCFPPQISITKSQLCREIRTSLATATSLALLQNKTTDYVKTPPLPFLFVKLNIITRLSLSRVVLHPLLSRIVLCPFPAHRKH